jgi:hypothetical protein
MVSLERAGAYSPGGLIEEREDKIGESQPFRNEPFLFRINFFPGRLSSYKASRLPAKLTRPLPL